MKWYVRFLAVVFLLWAASYVFSADYTHHLADHGVGAKHKKPYAQRLQEWHERNYAWVQVGQAVSPRPAPKGLGVGRWVAYGVWEEQRTTYTWRKECRNGICRMYRVPVVQRIRHKVDLRKQKSVVRKAARKTRPAIAPARRNWVYYAGNYGDPLRQHNVTAHGMDPAKLKGLSDADLRRLHSHAHEGTLDEYWHR